MADTVMLNVRMNPQVKSRGCQVLQKNGMSASDFVRSAFEYLEQYQQLPQGIEKHASAPDAISQKRQILRRFAGCIENGDSEPIDAKQMHAERLDEKYKEYLA